MKLSHLVVPLLAATALVSCKEKQAVTPVPEAAVKVTQANPPAGGTWADVVNETAAGGFMMGNPNAKVKLVEIASLSCPHCRAFEEEGMPALVAKYVTPGTVSWELRPYVIHGPIDVAADLVVRCNGPKTFFPLVRALYKDQPNWMAKLQSLPPEKYQQMQALPPSEAFIAMGNAMGLQDWAALRGVTKAKSNKCLADQAMISEEVQHVTDVTSQFPNFTGTPAFIINGTMLDKDATSFDKVEPALREALR
jgi:protein-disulfide isomerase